jgi:hypothetical protein
LWYPAHAIFGAGDNPLFDPKVFAPYGFDLIRNQDLSPATVLLFSPVTRLFGEVFTYNLLIMLSFCLTAFGTYLLAKEFWGSRPGALVAGVAVGFCEYRFSHATGHLTIATTQWIPFCLLFLERTVTRPGLKNGLLFGLFFALSTLSTWYYGLLTVLAIALFLAVRVRWWRDRAQVLHLVRPGAAAVLVFAILVGPFAVLNAIGGRGLSSRGLEESQAFSAALADFVIPGAENPLTRSWILNNWRNGANGLWLSEWEVYVGAVALILAIVGLRNPEHRKVAALLFVAAGSLIIALGPSFYLTHPNSIPGAENAAPLSPIPLPVRFLSQIPPFTFLRAWARMAFFLQIAIGLLAAAGVASIMKRLSSRRLLQGLFLTAVIAVATFETLGVPFGTASTAPRPVDRWLAKQPGDFVVMEYPVPDHAYSGPAMYSRRLTGKAIVMGYGSFPPNLKYWEVLAKFPEETTIDLLKSWGVRYVLVDEELYKTPVEFWLVKHDWASLEPAIQASPSLELTTQKGSVKVYELD